MFKKIRGICTFSEISLFETLKKYYIEIQIWLWKMEERTTCLAYTVYSLVTRVLLLQGLDRHATGART